jgi:hypothetical protein
MQLYIFIYDLRRDSIIRPCRDNMEGDMPPSVIQIDFDNPTLSTSSLWSVNTTLLQNLRQSIPVIPVIQIKIYLRHQCLISYRINKDTSS